LELEKGQNDELFQLKQVCFVTPSYIVFMEIWNPEFCRYFHALTNSRFLSGDSRLTAEFLSVNMFEVLNLYQNLCFRMNEA
jgi:hypothetical protein